MVVSTIPYFPIANEYIVSHHIKGSNTGPSLRGKLFDLFTFADLVDIILKFSAYSVRNSLQLLRNYKEAQGGCSL